MKAVVKCFVENYSNTMQYVVHSITTKEAFIVDPVLDYHPETAVLHNTSIKSLLAYIQSEDLKVKYILDTHTHADHVTGSKRLAEALPSAINAIGEGAAHVQEAFSKLYELEPLAPSVWKQLLKDNDVLTVGDLEIECMAVPGHTPDSMAYYVRGCCCFVGDTMFMPDSGTARCDFPNGNASTLYDSCQRILSLPDSTKLYMCHDYGKGGRELQWETSVAEQKASNIHLANGASREDFTKMRSERDDTLKLPHLIVHALQMNIRAGDAGPVGSSGHAFVKLPVNAVDNFSTSSAARSMI